MPAPQPSSPPTRSRVAAGLALALYLATLALLAVFTAQELPYVVASLLCGGLCITTLWVAATSRRLRWWACATAVVFLGGAIASLVLTGRNIVEIFAALVAISIASALGSLAPRWEVRQALAERWHPSPPSERAVLFVNPRSGDGKAARVGLVDEAAQRGIEVVTLQPGNDLRAMAEQAVARGADVLGMAGGDGSQATVAAVAAAHGLAFACVPVGTRNHFALDLGIDPGDPVRALNAFGPAREALVDLGEVNGEVFVNNVSLGVYAKIVASDKYRSSKGKTVAELLPDLLGPDAEPYGLAVTGPRGTVTDASVIEVSNNPYRLASFSGFGSRPRLDSGTLGVAALSIKSAPDVNVLVASEVAGHPERYRGWRSWACDSVVVDGPASVPAAIDGEARTLTAPLHFRSAPAALRARIAMGERGASPAFLDAPVSAGTPLGLVRTLLGKPSGAVPDNARTLT